MTNGRKLWLWAAAAFGFWYFFLRTSKAGAAASGGTATAAARPGGGGGGGSSSRSLIPPTGSSSSAQSTRSGGGGGITATAGGTVDLVKLIEEGAKLAVAGGKAVYGLVRDIVAPNTDAKTTRETGLSQPQLEALKGSTGVSNAELRQFASNVEATSHLPVGERDFSVGDGADIGAEADWATLDRPANDFFGMDTDAGLSFWGTDPLGSVSFGGDTAFADAVGGGSGWGNFGGFDFGGIDFGSSNFADYGYSGGWSDFGGFDSDFAYV
jgi:hypothetical protein